MSKTNEQFLSESMSFLYSCNFLEMDENIYTVLKNPNKYIFESLGIFTMLKKAVHLLLY